MKRNAFIRTLLSLLMILMIFLSPAGAFAEVASSIVSQDATIEYLKSILDWIEDKYNGEVDLEQLIEGALSGMFEKMDDYTVFYTPEEADTFLQDVQGNYEGIGIMMSIRDGYITVVKVFSDSPAQRAGLVIGDRIVTVGDRSVFGSSLDIAAALIKGEAGTKVELGIIKNGQSNTISIEVERASVKYNPVNYEIRGEIGYIQLDMFNSNTYEFVDKALGEMDAKGIDKIIMDLRGNPGGTVDQAVMVAQRFVPEGSITKLAFKSNSMPDIEYVSELKELKYELVILVNSMTASASEILAGAVQDTESGIVIGTKTFGKSKVQNILPILAPSAYEKYEEQLGEKIIDAYDLIRNHGIVPRDEEVVGWTKITTGEYLTPLGRVIDGVGIIPDIKVEDPILVMDISISSVQELQKTVKPELGSEGIDVLNAEKILRLLGFTIDAPDMILDDKTFEAIAKYQEKRGLYPYGVLDFTTQQKLNEDLEELMRTIDKQYGKAVEYLSNL